jgi:hypothetical protein
MFRMAGRQSIRFHLLVGMVIVCVVIPLRGALRDRYAAERRDLQREAANQRVLQLSAQWASAPYVEPTVANIERLLDASEDWARLELPEPQRGRLRERLVDVLGYLGAPTLETYYRLKTEGLSWRFEPEPKLLPVAQERSFEVGEALEFVEELWEATRSRVDTSGRHRVSAMADLSMTLSRVNSVEALLGGAVGKGMTVARGGVDPGFRYVRSVAVGGADGLFVHLSFLARSNASEHSGPVHLSLSWSEADRDWILSRLITDELLGITILF